MVNSAPPNRRMLLATDLDGTILPKAGSFNPSDVEALHSLGQKGVIRVVATGRTIHSALGALSHDFPIDYLVFSSGAGVFNFKSRELMQTLHLNHHEARLVMNHLTDRGLGFTIHHAIPQNHKFWYQHPRESHPDFERYLTFNAHHASPLDGEDTEGLHFCQLLAFLPGLHALEEICEALPGVKWVRATSPIDGESVWMEFFHPDVSKASGIDWVCNHEKINREDVWVLGNDFNDLDMLSHYKPKAFVVDNAPDELKEQFIVVPSVTEGGLAHLVSGERFGSAAGWSDGR